MRGILVRFNAGAVGGLIAAIVVLGMAGAFAASQVRFNPAAQQGPVAAVPSPSAAPSGVIVSPGKAKASVAAPKAASKTPKLRAKVSSGAPVVTDPNGNPVPSLQLTWSGQGTGPLVSPVYAGCCGNQQIWYGGECSEGSVTIVLHGMEGQGDVLVLSKPGKAGPSPQNTFGLSEGVYQSLSTAPGNWQVVLTITTMTGAVDDVAVCSLDLRVIA